MFGIKRPKDIGELLINPRILFLTIFFLAVLVRLIPIFAFTGPDNVGPGWYTDTYHHWQIGYFSKEIGLSQGRLWDLKGMEYFWGIGHPLILAFLFSITGSNSLLVPRFLSLISGAAIAGLIGVLMLRWFSPKIAWPAAIWAALSPVAVFSDQLGLQEPVGLLLLLLGVYYASRKPALAGLFWALAGTIRAEFWLFGFALSIIATFKIRNFDRKTALLGIYLVITLIHMKILFDKTGNAIYPIWWNFLANARGDWLAAGNIVLTKTPLALLMKIGFWVTFFISIWVIVKKPRGYLFLLLGLFNLGFLIFMGGFSAYTIFFRLSRFYVDRLWAFPYTFLGVVVIIWLRKLPKMYIFIFTLSLFLISSLLAWPFILGYFNSRSTWGEQKLVAQRIARYYRGGKVLIPPDRPELTYSLVHLENIKAKNIIGQMYTPLSNTSEDIFLDWRENRLAVLRWFKQNNIGVLFINEADKEGNFGKLVDKEKRIFVSVESQKYPNFWIYKVNLNAI